MAAAELDKNTGSMSGRKEQLIRTLSSRAETAPLSKPMFAAWLAAAVFVQFVWGLWAVCTRFLQVGSSCRTCWQLLPFWAANSPMPGYGVSAGALAAAVGMPDYSAPANASHATVCRQSVRRGLPKCASLSIEKLGSRRTLCMQPQPNQCLLH
jgi:hypothetical protein